MIRKLAPIAKYGITILASVAMVSCAAPDSAARSGVYYATCSCDPGGAFAPWPEHFTWSGPYRNTYAEAEADAEAHIRAGCSRPMGGRRAWVVGPH